ncbi:protein SEC13 homolog isoform X2 [Parasteatoda tepidariorum]|uniref:protein SEC13 homolog isoform X2 n=1 Tax=Parasteatoda tepidariorum TaxID=114398 RepID=UPI00077F834C|nr:protein SEC13 homolog isoform X2 [Parasteatoda tepidariorum]
MVSLEQDVDTGHSDMIHDAQMDYNGLRLATCSSDKNVKIFNVRNGLYNLVTTLKGHEGPVWQVAWSHPLFGPVLASCSYDRKVIIWKEIDEVWKNVYEYNEHDSSVNSISWAPCDYGLILACGSSDGSISILSSTGEGDWEVKRIHNAHTIGCNAVSWGPINAQIAYATTSDCLESTTYPSTADSVKRFVTGGCDNLVKIWKYCKQDQWSEEEKLEAHSNWVRDVVWAPSVNLGQSVIASCSQDKRVIIWTKTNETPWIPKTLHTFDDVIWHVSFSVTGSILAVSGGDNKVSLWKVINGQRWVHLNDVNQGQIDQE